MSLEIVRTVADLRAHIGGWRGDGHSVGLVPTMGALHEGHLSLVRQSLDRAARTCVTLFVNPKQFGPNEDLAVYPREEAADAAKLETEGAHLLFAPGIEEMYPDGAATKVSVPGLGGILEGQSRPGFFDGVATVVAKLLIQAQPDIALFGEKDYQQLQVIKRMVADLNIPVHIEGGAIVREADGLALSSRNVYLSPEERAVAPTLNATIKAVAERFAAGEDAAALSAWAVDQLLEAGFGPVDYVTVRDAASLEPLTRHDGTPSRVLAAAKLGRTRLIDNVAV
ncbi:MAG: pantoate--beta-alanine ligase [Rhodospirillales bacterium]|nr:pantoate--beta-alanine ligase [Rhodospirillales bacterium]